MDSSEEAISSQVLNPGPESRVVLRTRALQIRRDSLPSVSRMDALTPYEQPRWPEVQTQSSQVCPCPRVTCGD